MKTPSSTRSERDKWAIQLLPKRSHNRLDQRDVVAESGGDTEDRGSSTLLGEVTGAGHESGAAIDELTTASAGSEAVSTEALGRVLGSGELVTGGGTSLGTGFNSVVFAGVEQGGEKSAIGTLGDDTVRGPTSGELNGSWGEVGVKVPVDSVGSTADLVGVTGTWHVALARDGGILDVV